MANYNSSSMWAGALGEALDAGQTYTFALQTFALKIPESRLRTQKVQNRAQDL